MEKLSLEDRSPTKKLKSSPKKVISTANNPALIPVTDGLKIKSAEFVKIVECDLHELKASVESIQFHLGTQEIVIVEVLLAELNEKTDSLLHTLFKKSLQSNGGLEIVDKKTLRYASRIHFPCAHLWTDEEMLKEMAKDVAIQHQTTVSKLQETINSFLKLSIPDDAYMEPALVAGAV
eukprot:TRINITY_DN4027_c0_g1_i2.p1 TRINITY_DN4027_c0_g1~~TRINITY_DN4027_c0_g1_i2.p1  ORF type:complete len:198 (-),score=25.93 TRINITY_DN4027_c0_g1_i2:196-729(-)